MAERSVALEGANLGLVVVLCVLWLALGLLVVGPGRSSLSSARDRVQEGQARMEDWQDRFGGAAALSDARRRAWTEDFERLRRTGPPGDDEPGLTAWVAAALRAPSVRRLEVLRQESQRAEAHALSVVSPQDRVRLELRAVSLRVRFLALYEDLSRLLARLEAPGSAFEIRRIELQRKVPEVQVELELDLWTHREVPS